MTGEEVGKIIDPENLQFNIGKHQEREGIWQPIVRRLTYKGIEGNIFFYHDGIADRLVFINFPSGTKWNKLARSIQGLKRETGRGRYNVELGRKKRGIEVSLVYSDRDYLGRQYLQKRFEDIWRDLSQQFPQKQGLVKLGKAQTIEEFNLQDLSV